MKIEDIDRSRLAKTDQEFLELTASDADWIARSPADVQSLRDAKVGAFARLADENYYEFFNSLKFSNGGLAALDYAPLMNDLSLTEIFEVFARFGLARDYTLPEEGGTDHDNMWCEPPHTCSPKRQKICTANC